MAEFGIVAPIGRNGLDQLLAVLSDLDDQLVPALARDCLVAVAEQLMLVKRKTLDMDRRIVAYHRWSDMSRRLAEMPGVGPLVATALVATVPDPRAFASWSMSYGLTRVRSARKLPTPTSRPDLGLQEGCTHSGFPLEPANHSLTARSPAPVQAATMDLM